MKVLLSIGMLLFSGLVFAHSSAVPGAGIIECRSGQCNTETKRQNKAKAQATTNILASCDDATCTYASTLEVLVNVRFVQSCQITQYRYHVTWQFSGYPTIVFSNVHQLGAPSSWICGDCND